jgi:hypothetical protein
MRCAPNDRPSPMSCITSLWSFDHPRLIASDEHDVFSCEHSAQERLTGATATMEFLACIQGRADTAAELPLRGFEGAEHIVEGEPVGDQQDVDVAFSGVGILDDRPKQRRELDAVRERCQRSTKLVGDACGLRDDLAKLLEDRCCGVRLVALLAADRCGVHELAIDQPLKLALDCAGSGGGKGDQLGGREGTLGLAEQQREHSLLSLGEQRIRDRCGRRGLPRVRTAAPCAHFGHRSTHIGYQQASAGGMASRDARRLTCERRAQGVPGTAGASPSGTTPARRLARPRRPGKPRDRRRRDRVPEGARGAAAAQEQQRVPAPGSIRCCPAR